MTQIDLQPLSLDVHKDITIDTLCQKRIITLMNLEKLYAESSHAKIINQDQLVTKKLSEDFSNAIFAASDDDIPYLPSCDCGYLKGVAYEGMECPKCQSIVSTDFVNHLEHAAWLGIPEGLPKVLHPMWYTILKEWTGGKKEASLIDIILNPNEDIPSDLENVILDQGFDYFYANADSILQYLMNKYPRTASKKNTKFIKMLYDLYKDIMFTSKLPILHNSLHPIISGSSTLKYADKIGKSILQATYDLSAITFDTHKYISTKTLSPTQRRDMNILLFDIYHNVMDYYEKIIKDKIGSKPAMARKHNLGTRCHFTIRTVVVPIPGAHNFDEIYLPWKMVVNTYKLEIINLLMNRYGYTFNKALSTFMKALTQYDTVVHEVLETLKSECPYKGFPFLIGRNPTLRLYSIMLLFGTKIKTNINDEAMSISPGILTGSNTDFDGDELYGENLKENGMVDDYQVLHPREAVLDTDSPGISSLVMPSNQALLNLHKFISQNPPMGEKGYEIIT